MKKTSADNHEKTEESVSLSKALRGAQQLVIYRKVLSDPIVASFLDLLEQLNRNAKLTRKGLLRMTESYATFFSRLAERTVRKRAFAFGTPWQDHLLDLIFNDENLFSSHSQDCSPGGLGKSLVSQIESDLARLQRLYHVDSESVVGPHCEGLIQAASGSDGMNLALCLEPTSRTQNVAARLNCYTRLQSGAC